MSNTHPPVLIFTIEGRPATIWNVGFMPSRPFSPYAEFEEFVKEIAEVQQTPENFCTYLISKGLGDYLEPELVPENASRFMTWNLVPTAKDFGTTFDIIHRFPTVMTQHLLEQLASGWVTPIFQVAKFSREDYFRFLKEKAISVQEIEKLRWTVAKSALQAKEDALIAEHGYTKQYVSSDGSAAQFCYSIGLTPRVGAEFLVIAALPMGLMAASVDVLAQELLTGTLTLGERTDIFKPTDGIAQLRLKIVQVDAAAATKDYILNTRGEVTRVYQILFADENNILPDEVGYDDNMKQPVLMQLKDPSDPSEGLNV